METATARLSALAHETRLQIFRRLVQAGPNGIAAGDLARALAVPANTLSAHLNILSGCGLILGRRESRSRIYAAQYDAMRELIAFLLEDCCQGNAEMCAPLLTLVTASDKTCC